MEDEKQTEEEFENECQEEYANALQAIKDGDLNEALRMLKSLYWRNSKLPGLIQTLDEVETEVWKRSSPVYNSSSSQKSSLLSKLYANEYIQTDPIIDSRTMVSLGVQTDLSYKEAASPDSDEESKKSYIENEIIIVKRKIPDYHLSNNRKVRNCLNLSMLDDDDEDLETPTYPKRNAIPIP